MQRDARDHLLEFARLDAARQDAHHPVPAVHGDEVHHVLVDELVPEPHAGIALGLIGAQRRGVREGVFQVFVDHRGVGDDEAVVIQHRHLALGIEGGEPGLVLLELVQVDIDALELEALFLQGNQGLERIGRRLGVIELERHLASSATFSLAGTSGGLPRPGEGPIWQEAFRRMAP